MKHSDKLKLNRATPRTGERKTSEQKPEESQEPKEKPRAPDFILFHRTDKYRETIAVVSMVLILILFRFQALLYIDSAYLGGFQADAGLYVWLVKSNIRDLFSLAWFNTAAFYPYTETLAWSDNFILPSLVIMLLTKLSLSLVVSYNLVLLLAGFLNGYLTYRLCLRLTGAFFPSLAAGASFLALSYFSSQLGHPQLQFAFFFPLGVSFFFSYLSRRNLVWAVLFGLLTFCAFLTTIYYSVFLPILILSLFVVIKALRPQQITAKDFSLFGLCAFIGLSPVLFFIFPYLDIREMFGERYIYESYYFGATAYSYLSAGPYNLIYNFTSGLSSAEAHLTPGLIILLWI